LSISWITGAHTIGLARCVQFRAHIYNDSNVDPLFRKSLQNKCPRSGNDNVLEPFDYQTPTHFDNLYFKHLLAKKALLHSDQELFNIGSSTNNLVKKYATDNAEFFKAFAEGMVKMSSIKPLTGSNGQIRTNCRKINWKLVSNVYVCVYIYYIYVCNYSYICSKWCLIMILYLFSLGK